MMELNQLTDFEEKEIAPLEESGALPLMFDEEEQFQKIKKKKENPTVLKNNIGRYKKCESGKVRYESKQIALFHAKRVCDFFERKTAVYKCKECKGWHLTTVKEKVWVKR